MGAGDSFIAGFLTAYGDGRPMEVALDYCSRAFSFLPARLEGGFGHPHPLD